MEQVATAVLIFTFGPIQPFIVEARRAGDLYVGSQILVDLARAAVESIQRAGGELIYPIIEPVERNQYQKPTQRGRDTPNRLVARVPEAQATRIAENTCEALLDRWQKTASEAKDFLLGLEPGPDDTWRNVWERQTGAVWETHWAVAPITDAGPEAYSKAYERASAALDAAKRLRAFAQVAEPGRKDTLSGRREALRTATLDAPPYWAELAANPEVTAAKLRPGGRERLDAVGATKRFCALARRPFPSTSTVAAWDFLQKARSRIQPYAALVRQLGPEIFEPRQDDRDWPYDGDLLFPEGLTPARLLDSYGLANVNGDARRRAEEGLRALYKEVKLTPAPYYAIIVFDGDDMGQHVSKCLQEKNPETSHREFSRKLSRFADAVQPLAVRAMEGLAGVVYNGGDDVLALAPLLTAIPTAQALAEQFSMITGATASAGIAVVHHTSPLGAGLRAARMAERQAKALEGKAAVCVRIHKRSGESSEVRCSWEALNDHLTHMVDLFAGDPAALSSKFAFDVADAAYALPLPDTKWRAEVKRLATRHSDNRAAQRIDSRALAEQLGDWAGQLPGGTEELGRWLVFARFLAQRGGE